MDQTEKQEMFKPVRYAAAAAIALGGFMHVMGVGFTLAGHQAFPWYCWAVFMAAILGYPVSAILILKNRRLGYVLAFGGPLIGGFLIFLGFIFPGSGLLMLIPGTFVNEITPIGFLTLIIEPLAVASAAFCLVHRVWNRG